MTKIWVYHTFKSDDNEDFKVSIKHIIVAKNKDEANKILISYEKPAATEMDLNKKFETTTDMLAWLNADNDLGIYEWDSSPYVNWVALSGKLAVPMFGVGYYRQLIAAIQEFMRKTPNPQLEKMVNKRIADVRKVENFFANR